MLFMARARHPGAAIVKSGRAALQRLFGILGTLAGGQEPAFGAFEADRGEAAGRISAGIDADPFVRISTSSRIEWPCTIMCEVRLLEVGERVARIQ